MEHTYPLASGTRDHAMGSASKAAALNTDRDPLRKLNTYVAICTDVFFGPAICTDELPVYIDEPIRYLQPRVSELITMGILAKGAHKVSPTSGRNVHVLEPGDILVDALLLHRPDSRADLDRVFRAMITARRDSIAEATRVTRAG